MRSKNLNVALILLLVLLGATYLRRRLTPTPAAPVVVTTPAPPGRSPPQSRESRPVPSPTSGQTTPRPPPAPTPARPPSASPGANKPPTVRYRIDDGIAVVQGDVAVGVLSDPAAPANGVVTLAPLRLWEGGEIAYWIQPSVENPERIRQALALFTRTRLRFVEFSGQADALVFEPTRGICKSYLGRIGGHQPIWVAPGCGPAEIAHEVMHALGFAHEQNRADRDDYISVNVEGIEDEYRYNFDKLPPAYTKVNQTQPFDFTSLMMYPPWMFAKGGQTTMFPRNPDQQIAPGSVLSTADEARINALH